MVGTFRECYFVILVIIALLLIIPILFDFISLVLYRYYSFLPSTIAISSAERPYNS